MKKIWIYPVVLLVLSALVACDAGTELPLATTTVPDVTIEEPSFTEYTEDSRALSGRASTFKRDLLEVPVSETYMLRATLSAEKQTVGAKLGLCAGTNAHGQTLDFFLTVGGEFGSFATLYGKEIRADLGLIPVAVSSPKGAAELVVLRRGDYFYFVSNGELVQIREFRCDPTAPGFSVTSGTAEYTKIEYTSDPGAVDSAIAAYLAKTSGYGIGDGYANFGGITFHDEGSFTIPENFLGKDTKYSRIAFADAYSGDMEITFTVKDLKPLASADNSGDAMCRLRLLLYSEYDVVNMICLGVANKQDCVETYAYYDIAQWCSHADLTGKKADFFDWSRENEIRIRLTNTGRSNTYTVYVNGELCAARSVLANGPVQFGFEAENVCGTVQNFKVTGGEVQ